MPNDSFNTAQVQYTAEFKRTVRVLAKRYPHIRSDFEPLVNDLKLGKTPGDQVPGVGYTVFKVRLRNRDTQKGKRAGYRVIYYLKTLRRIVLLTVYSKLEQSDIPVRRIQKIIRQHEQGYEL